ncbi:MAG: imidazoleglycerol-phosphate dehydratase HisB [Termitinemataceae bacterium]|nr:MAG: imidazoleglycerol-phosphate dehydratase HisB [Termitinemataceae bacterium]
MNRIAEVQRKTLETDIFVKINIDGSGTVKFDYPIGFMRHMLNTFAHNAMFDLEIKATGDLDVDQHHLMEDTGITLGSCLAKALGDKHGIVRAAHFLYPMDETLARAVIDLCGRSYLVLEAALSGAPIVTALETGKYSTFQSDTIYDFWQGFCGSTFCTLHLDILRGRSDHHKIEALFKAAGRALRTACSIDAGLNGAVPSTKGVLDPPQVFLV